MSEETAEGVLETFGLLASLPSAEGYTAQDKYRDFRRVLLGSDDGKRVLREILAWGHQLQPSAVGRPIDGLATHFRDGERNIGIKLLKTLLIEPKEGPTQTKRQS